MQRHCNKCRTELVAGENWAPSYVRKGVYTCRPCASARCRRWAAANPEKIKAYRLTYKPAVKRQKTHNGWEWAISKEIHLYITSGSCFYCRGPLNPTGTALDRIDSSIGYTLHNVVPCCRRCNRMKSDLLSADEMLLLWAIRRGEIINPLEDEIYALPEKMRKDIYGACN